MVDELVVFPEWSSMGPYVLSEPVDWFLAGVLRRALCSSSHFFALVRAFSFLWFPIISLVVLENDHSPRGGECGPLVWYLRFVGIT